MIKVIASIVLAMAALPSVAVAMPVHDNSRPAHEGQQGAKHDRNRQEFKRWMVEMKEYKHDFLARELALTAEQKEQFFSLYDNMESEKWKLSHDVRKMEREVSQKGDAATDLELEKAADACVELQGRQNEIERRYHAQFKKILTKRQLFKLVDAERKFQKQLMEQRGKNRK